MRLLLWRCRWRDVTLELDIDATSDGHIIVIHDDTVDRTTSGTGHVTSHTLAALQQLDAGAWFGAAFAGELGERKGHLKFLSPALKTPASHGRWTNGASAS